MHSTAGSQTAPALSPPKVLCNITGVVIFRSRTDLTLALAVLSSSIILVNSLDILLSMASQAGLGSIVPMSNVFTPLKASTGRITWTVIYEPDIAHTHDGRLDPVGLDDHLLSAGRTRGHVLGGWDVLLPEGKEGTRTRGEAAGGKKNRRKFSHSTDIYTFTAPFCYMGALSMIPVRSRRVKRWQFQNRMVASLFLPTSPLTFRRLHSVSIAVPIVKRCCYGIGMRRIVIPISSQGPPRRLCNRN